MAYIHIDNLYKNKDILEFRRCYALEKVHGTSAHIRYSNGKITFYQGGVDRESFVKLFDSDFLMSCFKKMDRSDITIFGEAYGGKCQAMAHTYGKELQFIVFEVLIGRTWLNVPSAEEVALSLNLEYVPYNLISTDIDEIDRERDADSIVAIRRGMGTGKKREGVVLRPPFEVIKNNGERIIAKHKRDDFRETKKPRDIKAEQLEVLTKATEIADEWVTEMRLTHILDKLPKPLAVEDTPIVIKAMLEDIAREGRGEYMDSVQTRKMIGTRTAQLFKKLLKQTLVS